VQPIAVADVLAYLLAALDEPRAAGQVLEIGGATVETYASMMRMAGSRWLWSGPSTA
jgi:uncharacterized protein YbjT (DUF2867 family)